MTEDAELLRHYADEKSEAAFAALVQRRIGLVYSVALRQVGGDAHLAQDVTQKVFTDLARKAAQLCRRPVLSGWLCRSAQFAASDLVRAERRRRARERETELMPESSPEPNAADWEKLRPMLDQVLNELDDADRDALALRFFEDRSFADIGLAFRLTEDAARKRVSRALDRLHARLGRRGVTSTSAALAGALANQTSVAAPAGLSASVTGTALASAGAGAATALGFLQIMSTTKFIAGAAATLAFLAFGTAGYKLHARHGAEAALTTANQNYAALAPRLRDVQQRAQAAEQRTAEVKQAVDAAEAKAAADAAAKAWNPVAEGKALVQRHPELVPVMVDAFNARIDLEFGRFYKSRRLTSAQVEEFRSLQARMRNYSWAESVDGKRFEMSPDHFGTMSRSEGISRLRALLGAEGMAELSTYAAAAHERAVGATIEVSKDLCLTETPLTTAQAERLVDLFRAGFPGSGSNRDIAAGNVNWSAIDAGARQILADAQLSAWETAFRRARARISRVVSETNSPPAK